MDRLYGIQRIIIAHYDRTMMTTPWREFVTDYLVRDHGAVHLVVGHDFHFGHRGEGDPQKLRALCERQDFFDRRLLRSFPTSSSPRYPEALKRWKEYLENLKQ